MVKINKNNIVNNLGNYIIEKCGTNKPLCKLFETKIFGYLYDTGTNKILKCDEVEYFILKSLLNQDGNSSAEKISIDKYNTNSLVNAISEIKKAINDEGVLQLKEMPEFKFGGHFNSFIEKVENDLGMILLEVTERCNLRCGYCVYNDGYTESRNHGELNMSREIALKSIDYLKHHSSNKKNVSITFYGGEPLLNLPLIRECVEYAKSVLNDKTLTFSMTTNAMLLTPEISKFLFDNNFSILVSIDGPENIHDLWRRDVHGNGSFIRTSSGLKCLMENYKKQIERVGMNMVFTPPYSYDKAQELTLLWKELDWLPDDIRISISYPTPGSICIACGQECNFTSLKTEKSLFEWAKNNYISAYNSISSPHVIAKDVVENKAALILQRKIFKNSISDAYLNGCCIPFHRKLYITASGEIQLCERIGKTPYFGDIYSGIDINKVRNVLIEDYASNSIKSCSKCWAIHSCGICYQHAFKNGKLDMEFKNKQCSLHNDAEEEYLKLVCELLEINPKGLDHLYNIRIV